MAKTGDSGIDDQTDQGVQREAVIVWTARRSVAHGDGFDLV